MLAKALDKVSFYYADLAVTMTYFIRNLLWFQTIGGCFYIYDLQVSLWMAACSNCCLSCHGQSSEVGTSLYDSIFFLTLLTCAIPQFCNINNELVVVMVKASQFATLIDPSLHY